MNHKTRVLSFAALSAALLGILSQFSIPLPFGVPLTLQTFGVALTGLLLGPVGGCLATGVWLGAGCVGLPLFSGFRGGTAVLFGPTGGFLLGFLPMALCCGWAKNRPFRKSIIPLSAGLILCHLTGVAFFAWSGEVSFSAALLTASLPYLPKDLICLAAAYATARLIRKKIPSLG